MRPDGTRYTVKPRSEVQGLRDETSEGSPPLHTGYRPDGARDTVQPRLIKLAKAGLMKPARVAPSPLQMLMNMYQGSRAGLEVDQPGRSGVCDKSLVESGKMGYHPQQPPVVINNCDNNK